MSAWANLLRILSILAAGAALLAVWARGVRFYYRLRRPPPKLLRQRCSDGWELGVHYRPAARRRYAEPVVLCHGIAANHLNFDFDPPFSLALALAERGFDCFSVDWRGSSASRRSPGRLPWANYTIDDHIHKDAPALLEVALEQTGATRAFWVGHSLGGLIGLGAIQGETAGRLRGMVTVGAPVSFHYDPHLLRAVRFALAASWPYRFRQELLSSALAPFLGRVVLPFSDVVVYPRHVPPRLLKQLYALLITSVGRGVLQQLHEWITHNAFRSLDLRIDYRAGIQGIQQPLLFIAGSRDRLAPPLVVRGAYELAQSSDKTLKVFGREHGDSQEYGHGDLLFGERAPADVFPFIAGWLAARATPLDVDQPPTSADGVSSPGDLHARVG